MYQTILFWFPYLAYLLLTILLGRFLAKFSPIKSLNIPASVKYAIYWIIGFFSLAGIASITLFLGIYKFIPYIVWLLSSIIFYLNKDINLKVLYKKHKHTILPIAGFVIFLILFTQAKDFNLLWDARSSWFLKSKSFFVYDTFPNPLFLSSETNNIVKDYPLWNSLYYSTLARSLGFYSDMLNKLTQVIMTTFLLVITWSIIKDLLSKKFTIAHGYINLITTLLTSLIYGNYKFLEWTRSGYVDIFVALIITISSYLFIQFIISKNINYILSAILVGLFCLLLKNEGISLMVALVLTFCVYYLNNKYELTKTVLNKTFLDLKLAIIPVVLYVAWYVIKLRQNYKSDLVGGIKFDLTSLIEYAMRPLKLVSLWYNDLLNQNLWNYTFVLFIGIIVFLILYWIVVSSKSFVAKYTTLFLSIVSFFYILAYIITPEEFNFFYLVTFDRVVVQVLPSMVFVALCCLQDLFEKDSKNT
jgi:hypothetical protein